MKGGNGGGASPKNGSLDGTTRLEQVGSLFVVIVVVVAVSTFQGEEVDVVPVEAGARCRCVFLYHGKEAQSANSAMMSRLWGRRNPRC